MANLLLYICCSFAKKFEHLQVQLTVKVSVQNDDDIGDILRETEKYWNTGKQIIYVKARVK